MQHFCKHCQWVHWYFCLWILSKSFVPTYWAIKYNLISLYNTSLAKNIFFSNKGLTVIFVAHILKDKKINATEVNHIWIITTTASLWEMSDRIKTTENISIGSPLSKCEPLFDVLFSKNAYHMIFSVDTFGMDNKCFFIV